MAYVAREFATRENSTLQLGILPLKLTSLQVNTLKQRLNFLIRIVFQGICHINVAKRPRDGLGQTARHQKRQNENNHKGSDKRQRHASQERSKRNTRFRQAQNHAIGYQRSSIERIGSQCIRAAHDRDLARFFRLANFFAVRMVVKRGRISVIVEQNRAIRTDKRAAHIYKRNLGKRLRHFMSRLLRKRLRVFGHLRQKLLFGFAFVDLITRSRCGTRCRTHNRK